MDNLRTGIALLIALVYAGCASALETAPTAATKEYKRVGVISITAQTLTRGSLCSLRITPRLDTGLTGLIPP